MELASLAAAARRMSVAPLNRQSNLQSRSQGAASGGGAGGRHNSLFWMGRPTIFEGIPLGYICNLSLLGAPFHKTFHGIVHRRVLMI